MVKILIPNRDMSSGLHCTDCFQLTKLYLYHHKRWYWMLMRIMTIHFWDHRIGQVTSYWASEERCKFCKTLLPTYVNCHLLFGLLVLDKVQKGFSLWNCANSFMPKNKCLCLLTRRHRPVGFYPLRSIIGQHWQYKG